MALIPKRTKHRKNHRVSTDPCRQEQVGPHHLRKFKYNPKGVKLWIAK